MVRYCFPEVFAGRAKVLLYKSTNRLLLKVSLLPYGLQRAVQATHRNTQVSGHILF